ncbi:uncharacterized protein [Diabrotica undecimpunctata]|uniref:uncharacterized protein n=1 Tax=Diabrotica undecimpunctata TaxID=50387 RepID=UPI003B635609
MATVQRETCTLEANVLENTLEFSLLDLFVPLENMESSNCSKYYDEVQKKEYPFLNGDDKFLDSIIKDIFNNDDHLLEESIADDNFSQFDDLRLFDSSSISVLGVNLDLHSNDAITKTRELDLFDDCINLDLDLEITNSRVNDVLPLPFEINMENNVSEPLGIFEMFPHMNDERNRRRRNLLYETTCKKTPKDPPSEDKHFIQSSHALITHDYTQKREEDKYFSCPIANCEKVYAKASHLKAHLRRHSGEKPFICNWLNCTWRFSRSDELARHKRSHSGVKPYKCELCEKAFARSDHLSKHKKVHKKKMSQYGTYHIRKRARYSVLGEI